MFNEIINQTDQLITYSKNLLTKLSYNTYWIKEELVRETINFIVYGKAKSEFQIGFIHFVIKREMKRIEIRAKLNIEESVEFEFV